MSISSPVIVGAVAVAAVPVVTYTTTLDVGVLLAAVIAAIPSTLGVVLLYLQGRNTAKSVDGVVTQLTTAAKTEGVVQERADSEARKIAAKAKADEHELATIAANKS